MAVRKTMLGGGSRAHRQLTVFLAHGLTEDSQTEAGSNDESQQSAKITVGSQT